MRTILREIRKSPLAVCGVFGVLLFLAYAYPAPLLWLRDQFNEKVSKKLSKNFSEWRQRREIQWRADEMNAARELHVEGKLDAAAEKLERLLSHPPKRIYWPYPGHIRQELALVRRDQGRFEDALREVNWLITREPNYLDFYLTRVEIFFAMKEWREVLHDCEEVIDRVKDKGKLENSDISANYRAWQKHSLAWARMGEYQKAEVDIRKIIRDVPSDRENYALLAEVYARQKDYKQAHKYSLQAFELRTPDLTDDDDVASWCLVANVLAEFLATCPDASVRDGKQAKQIAEEVLAKSDRFTFAKTTLAAAYAELGDFEKAVELQSQFMALPLLHANSSHQQARLESYQRKQPFRLMRYEEP